MVKNYIHFNENGKIKKHTIGDLYATSNLVDAIYLFADFDIADSSVTLMFKRSDGQLIGEVDCLPDSVEHPVTGEIVNCFSFVFGADVLGAAGPLQITARYYNDYVVDGITEQQVRATGMVSANVYDSVPVLIPQNSAHYNSTLLNIRRSIESVRDNLANYITVLDNHVIEFNKHNHNVLYGALTSPNEWKKENIFKDNVYFDNTLGGLINFQTMSGEAPKVQVKTNTPEGNRIWEITLPLISGTLALTSDLKKYDDLLKDAKEQISKHANDIWSIDYRLNALESKYPGTLVFGGTGQYIFSPGKYLIAVYGPVTLTVFQGLQPTGTAPEDVEYTYASTVPNIKLESYSVLEIISISNWYEDAYTNFCVDVNYKIDGVSQTVTHMFTPDYDVTDWYNYGVVKFGLITDGYCQVFEV